MKTLNSVHLCVVSAMQENIMYLKSHTIPDAI